VRANALQVWGHLQGTVRTVGRLEILSTGRLFGEVTVGSLMIDEGGLFRGQCYMDGQDVDELVPPVEARLLGQGDSGRDSAPAGGPARLAASWEDDESEANGLDDAQAGGAHRAGSR
jgi:hypothetical protein